MELVDANKAIELGRRIRAIASILEINKAIVKHWITCESARSLYEPLDVAEDLFGLLLNKRITKDTLDLRHTLCVFDRHGGSLV